MRYLALAFVAMLASAGLAHAQETTVAVAPLVDFVLPILLTLISTTIAVGLPILLTKLATRFNLQIEQEKRDALQTALTNAAGGLLQRLGDQARTLRVDVSDPNVADAVNRVVRGAPDALKWAGLTEEEIARRVLEKLPAFGAVAAPAPTHPEGL